MDLPISLCNLKKSKNGLVLNSFYVENLFYFKLIINTKTEKITNKSALFFLSYRLKSTGNSKSENIFSISMY